MAVNLKHFDNLQVLMTYVLAESAATGQEHLRWMEGRNAIHYTDEDRAIQRARLADIEAAAPVLHNALGALYLIAYNAALPAIDMPAIARKALEGVPAVELTPPYAWLFEFCDPDPQNDLALQSDCPTGWKGREGVKALYLDNNPFCVKTT